MSASEKFAYEEDPAPQTKSGSSDFVGEALTVLRRITSYVSGHEVTAMRGDLEKRVREHPGASIAIGFGVGLLLGKLIKR